MTIKQVFNTSADLDYPNVLPTLDLNFANTKTLDPRITFTRSSAGSYVGADGLIKYAGVNEARFDHDPTTGESLGLLIEESRANLISYSNQFDSSPAWSTFNVTVSAATDTTSPDGTNNVYKLVESSINDFRFIVIGITMGATPHTVSVWMKAGTRNQGSLFLTQGGNNGATFTLTGSGSFSVFGTGNSASIIPYPNGWYRCTLTNDGSADINDSIRIGIMNGATSNYQGDGSSFIYIWGAQVEAGSFPTSYIPTVGSTKTRGAELASISGTNFSNFYNQTEGTFNFSTKVSKINTSVGQVILGVAERLVFNESIYISNDSGRNDITGIIIDGGVNQATFFSSVTITSGSFNKISLSYKKNDSAGSINSSNPQIDNNCTLPTVNTLKIGSAPWALTAATPFSGTIANITYFPKRLPNSQLQSLST